MAHGIAVSEFPRTWGQTTHLSRFAVDFPVPRRCWPENMTLKDIEIVEMPPPDMPAALYANAVDAYCTG